MRTSLAALLLALPGPPPVFEPTWRPCLGGGGGLKSVLARAL